MKNEKYQIYAILAIVFWALSYIFNRIAVKDFSPFQLNVFRYSIASVFMLMYLIVTHAPLPGVKDAPSIIVCGMFGFTIHAVTCSMGAQTVSTGMSSVIYATSPIFTAIMCAAIYHERLLVIEILAIALEMIGVIIMCIWGDSGSSGTGIFWILISAQSFSIYNVLQKKLVAEYDPMRLTAYCTIGASLVFFPFIPSAIQKSAQASPASWISVILLGLVCSSVAYSLWAKAIKHAERTSDITNYQFVSPVLSTFLGFSILQEIPEMSTWLGGLIVLAGMFLFQRCKRRKK